MADSGAAQQSAAPVIGHLSNRLDSYFRAEIVKFTKVIADAKIP